MNQNKSILFISKSPDQFQSAASALSAEGFSVSFASGVKPGIAAARRANMNMIVSELAVPDIDGLELCCRVRKDDRLTGTSVLLVGDLEPRSQIVVDSFRCGAADYLQRPFADGDLVWSVLAMQQADTETAEGLLVDKEISLLVAGSSIAAVAVDCDGRVLAANAVTSAMLGVGHDALVGSNLLEHLHPADRREFREVLNAVFWNVANLEPIDHRIRMGDGGYQLLRSTPQLVESCDGDRYVLLTLDGSTGYEPAGDPLSDALLKYSAVGVAIFSSTGRLQRANDALLELMGSDETRLRDCLLSEIIFPRDDVADRKAIVELLAGRRNCYKFQNGYPAAEGERTWGEVELIALEDRVGATGSLIAIFAQPAVESVRMMHAMPWAVDAKLISQN